MENIVDFISGVVFTYYFVAGLFLLAILLDHNERSGWSAFLAILSIYIVQDILVLSLMETGIFAALYIPIGLIWSGWRWKRHCSKIVNALKSFYDDNKDAIARNEKIVSENEAKLKVLEEAGESTRESRNDTRSYAGYEERYNRVEQDHLDNLKPNNNIGEILSWTFSWPISICSSMLSDIIDVVESFIRTRLIGIYNRISSNAMNEVSKYKDEKFKEEEEEVK
jgi:hypothetical protein